jgi:hypothetical protein
MHNVKPKSTAHTEQGFSNITRINNPDNKHIIYSAVTKLGIICTGSVLNLPHIQAGGANQVSSPKQLTQWTVFTVTHHIWRLPHK